jgi:hypothetical protein
VYGRKIVATARESLLYHNWHWAEFRFLSAGGKTVTVTVEDKCVACAEFDLEASYKWIRQGAFNTLADPLVRRLHRVTLDLF